jgi:general secretion pathway protein C
MARKKKTEKTATKITQSVEARIVELSLKHPDFGGGRLVPLLEQEGITVTTSAVYTILKRNNLQNKALRLAKLEEQQNAEIVSESVDTIEPLTKDPVPAPDHSDDATAPPRVTSVSKILPKSSVRRPWSLSIPNLLVLAIVGYFWVSALGNLLEARHEPTLPHDFAPVPVETTPQATVRPLGDYNIIFERNLFSGSGVETPAPEETVSVEDIPTAEKSLGLKLVGTVAGDDPATSFAIIDNKKTRKQELYHEGDTAGEVLIKRILRNKVIIDAGRGEELLALELQDSGERLNFSPTPQQQEKRIPSSARHRNLQLDRKEIEASLADTDGLIEQVNLSPYTLGTQKGFRITDIPPDSVLTKIGLRNGDVIKAVNDQPITGPEDAAAFLEKVRAGGDVEITISRRRRTMRISLQIE